MVSDTNKTSDEKLIEEVFNGNMMSFSILIERYSSFVFQIVIKITGDREFAEEITQDIFLKVYKNLHKFEFKSKFSTWLYRVTYTTTISANRKASRLFLVEDFEQQYSNEIYEKEAEVEWLDKGQLNMAFKKALSDLDEADNLIITLYYLNEQSIEDICTILNLKNSAVKTRLHRARTRLKKLLI
ncbi:RNA polymerase sigma factor [Sphingobacterium sp. 2149]|uniref:RNA polymerase sigma factor n=1 Tax=Sphingobacterium sp. 2149 TaxID=2817763 RepID=UPI00285BDB4D|nr:RNA polymerase sigma factor [Sphingobacterium sp. 2149]MDR6733414.1 RNA polymerase sigma-70 factor (ECF subfamily) [Sphingobacterium sp. 2149]